MLCSTIIPTIDRPTLARAVESVLNQAFSADRFEIIVVNDSGKPLADADWQRSERVQIIHTNRRGPSVARNTGAALAKGRYLNFLDDDDWLVPDAFESLWALVRRNGDAVLLYGGAEFVDGNGEHIAELNLGISGNCYTQLVAGSWIPISTAWVKTEAFFGVGGFHPLFTASTEPYLWRRIAMHGDLANTPAVVTLILRGIGWSTTSDHSKAVEFLRWSRDIAVSEPGAFGRLRASASSSYWHGRLFQAYLAATRWNLRRKRPFTAMSRAAFCMTGFVLAGRNLLSADFWRAVRDTQVPCTHARVLGPHRQTN